MRNCLVIFTCLIMASCNIPRDPEHSFEKIKNGTIRIGIAESPGLASFNDGQPIGREVTLVQKFAQQNNATITWVPGTQEMLAGLLQEYELDLAIGGFTKNTVFKKSVGLTSSYWQEKIKIGAPLSLIIPSSLKNQSIAVQSGSQAQIEVRKAGGIPVLYDSVPPKDLLVAAPIEDLYGFDISEQTLNVQEYVLAIPMGENALLMALENFIREQDGK